MMESSWNSRTEKPRVALGADHAGFQAKESLKKYLQSAGYAVNDAGAWSEESVDYPDLAVKVALSVREGRDDLGILICGTGIGMAMAANKVGGIRAAVAHDAMTARMSREHNDANVLAMGARVLSELQVIEAAASFLGAQFAGGRHQRRVDKISELDQEEQIQRMSTAKAATESGSADSATLERMNRPLRDVDPEIADILELEARRQAVGLELIPSENLVSEAVLEAAGSVLTNKYAEGYPGKRYYGGCEFVDRAEQLAIDRAKQLFGAEHANVQAHSGTQANISVYMTALQPGDTVLGMNLAHGGHLTHGHPLNFSGKTYKFIAYGVRKDTETIDYEEIERLAAEHKPKMIVAGASAYSRVIDFERMASIAACGGRGLFRGHGAHRGAGGRRCASQPGAARRLRFHHDAQNSARASRGAGALQAKMGQGAGPHHLSRNAGRAADAYDRGQGCLFEGSDAAGLSRISKTGGRQRQSAGRGHGAARIPHRQRRHG